MGRLLDWEHQTRAQLLGLFIFLWVAPDNSREEFHCSCCCLFLRPCQLLGTGDLGAGSSCPVPLATPDPSHSALG